MVHKIQQSKPECIVCGPRLSCHRSEWVKCRQGAGSSTQTKTKQTSRVVPSLKEADTTNRTGHPALQTLAIWIIGVFTVVQLRQICSGVSEASTGLVRAGASRDSWCFLSWRNRSTIHHSPMSRVIPSCHSSLLSRPQPPGILD